MFLALPAPAYALTVGFQDEELTTDTAVMDQVRATGAQWFRVPTFYPGDATWLEQPVSEARARGFRVLVTVGTWPGGETHPTRSGLARWSHQFAEQFCGRVEALEVWNEANDSTFLTPPGPRYYEWLLNGSYGAVKSACPSMKVVAAGTSSYPEYGVAKWWRIVKRAHFDIAAHHPLSYTGGPTHAARHLWKIREIVPKRPLWVTEFLGYRIGRLLREFKRAGAKVAIHFQITDRALVAFDRWTP